MNSAPLISIIINNYNYAQFLGAGIDSALNQTYQNTEILIIDDGSTDNSRQIIESYAERVKPVYKSNGGQASAFNTGIKNASGQIVIFLDSDDVLAPDCCKQVADFFTRDSELVCVRWYLEHIDQNGASLGSTNPPQGVEIPSGYMKNEILENGWRFNTPPTSGNAFSKSCLDEFFPIPEDLIRSADVYLFANTAVRGKLGFISRVLGFYRHNLENRNHFFLNRKKVLSEVIAGDITDYSVDSFFAKDLKGSIGIRVNWATAGDEMLRRILFKYSKQEPLPTSLYEPIEPLKYFSCHPMKQNMKYCIGLFLVMILPSEKLTFHLAGVLLGKHTLWGSKLV